MTMAWRPLVLLSTASMIANAIDIGFKVVGKSHEMYNSEEGPSLMDGEWKLLSSDLTIVDGQLGKPINLCIGCLGKEEQMLEALSQSCKTVVEDLLMHFNLIRAEGINQSWDLVRGVWGKDDIEALQARLHALKAEFELQAIVFLKNVIDWRSISQSEEYSSLNLHTKLTVPSLINDPCKSLNQHNGPKDIAAPTEGPGLENSQELTNTLSEEFSAVESAKEHNPTIGAINVRMEASAGKNSILQDFLLESLSFTAMKDREEEVSEAHQNTFGWIFDNAGTDPTQKATMKPGSNFLQWLRHDQEGGIYWINGKAGSGKSTLMRYIYDHKKTAEQLQSWAGVAPLTTAGFFFWTSGSLEQRSQIGLLRYLLFQVLQKHQDLIQNTFPEVWTHYIGMSTHERIKNPVSWSLQQLMKGLRSFLQHALGKTKIALFIDGLDEFDGKHEEIIDLFRSVATMSLNVKVCLSSRPWPVFVEAFHFVPSLKLQDLTFNDMLQYVHDKFHSDSRIRRIVRRELERGSTFMTEIVRRADGVFLWITLVVRSLLKDLQNSDKISDLEQRLLILPTDLDELFKHTLFDTQPGQYVKEASRVFQLIRAREIICDFTRNYSAASISIWELALADNESQDVAIDSLVHQASDEEISIRCRKILDRVDGRCAGLLGVYDKQSKRKRSGTRFDDNISPKTARRLAEKKVTYLHRTVRDFLVHSGAWDLLLTATVGDEFDPHVCHLRSYLMQLKLPFEEPEHHRRLDEWWPDIVSAMTHARYSSPSKNHISTPLLNDLNETLSWYWRTRSSDPNDTWARNAFGTYEDRKSTLFHKPFLSLATKFGLAGYIASELQGREKPTYTSNPSASRPLLSYATDFLIHRQYTLYPLSSPYLVETILQNGKDPNECYLVSSSKEETETPWLNTLKMVRQGLRRGWIRSYDTDREEGTQRWVRIMELFLEYGADANAVIRANQWDPEITAVGVVTQVLRSCGSKRVGVLREMMVKVYGAR